MKVPWIWHPFLMGLIPILSAYLNNQDEVGIRDLILPATLSLGVTVAVWALLAWRLRSIARAAPIVSVGFFCFFNFDSIEETGIGLWTSAGVLLAVLALLAFAARSLFRSPKVILASNGLLNIFSTLVVVSLVVLYGKAPVLANTQTAEAAALDRRNADIAMEAAANPARLPDIYYIVLDAYARSDVLRDIFDYDNSAFLGWLRHKGFYVADRSTSNYCQTVLSLSSSLNCRYHDRLAGSTPSEDEVRAMLRHNVVIETLKRLGYRFVSFATPFLYTDFPDADVYLSPAGAAALQNEFHTLLLDKTPLRLRTRIWTRSTGTLDSYAKLRQRTNFVFNTLGQIVPKYSPKFVFAHVVCPHPPFVFGEDGEDVSPHEIPYFLTDGSFYNMFYDCGVDYIAGYRRQAIYITRRAEDVIGDILRTSLEPPIIILQSDHGSGARWNCQSADPGQSDIRERLGILNSYYLPGGGDKGLYSDITPVNSFRLVLNNYFGAKSELLPDRSYLSSVDSRFQFVDVSARVR
jgi:hypothetical protein